ncbi:MAG TPA: NAD(P)-dependent oxidoreductase [Streptosporangiaceae bacterium]|jgi:hypothetical protein
MAKIAVFGASGRIGSRVVREALNRGHQVTAVVREPAALADRPDDLRVITGTVFGPAAVAEAVAGQDAVVLAVGGAGASGDKDMYVRAGNALVDAVRGRGDPPRIIVVGGAGSLEAAPGVRLLDTDGFPDAYRPEAEAGARALDFFRTVTDVPWTYLSPAAEIAPGERTGRYRTGTDRPVVADDGESHISMEDYAMALLDEIEDPKFAGRRFTVGY